LPFSRKEEGLGGAGNWTSARPPTEQTGTVLTFHSRHGKGPEFVCSNRTYQGKNLKALKKWAMTLTGQRENKKRREKRDEGKRNRTKRGMNDM